MATKFNKTQYVELLCKVGNAAPGFTPQQYLQNKQIYSCEAFSSEDINLSRQNVAVATLAMIEGMFVNFYCTDVNDPVQAIPNSNQVAGQTWGLWFRDIPMIELHRVSNGSGGYVRDLFEMYGTQINFEQSYVNITSTSLALITTGGVDVSVIFNFGYK